MRDRKDGCFVRADMTVTLASVTTDEGVPTSTVDLEIPEATMEAMDAATEAGDDAKIWRDLHITPSGGVKFVALEGPFTVTAGAADSWTSRVLMVVNGVQLFILWYRA